MEHIAVRAARRLGVSERRLGELIGVTPETPYKWKTGRQAPSGSARVLLELCLKLPASDIRRELEILEGERAGSPDDGDGEQPAA